MKCLLLVHNLPERGSYFRAHEIGKRLAARGHYVELICTSAEKKYKPRYSAPPYDKQPDTAEGRLVVVEAPYRTFFNDKQEGWSFFDNCFRLSRVAGHKWDLVYAFSHKPDCIAPGLYAKRSGAKLVMDWADWWGTPDGLYKRCVIPAEFFQALPRPIQWLRRGIFAAESWWEPKVYGAADVVTLISDEYLRHPRAPRGLEEKSLLLHSGAELEKIKPQNKTGARQRIGLNLNDDAVVLGYLANFHTGERLMLEAFAKVCAQRDDVYLLAIGSDFEKETPAIHNAIKDRVIHVGRQPFDRIEDHLGAADILLLPLNDVALDRARYPHKLSDYVAAGRPIVASDVGETGRILRRYKIGTLSPPDSDSFSEAILEVIAARGQWAYLNQKVRAAAEEHFNWDRLAEELVSFIKFKTGLDL